MRDLVLATDYDGTLAENGEVAPETLAALEKFKARGRKLILVTGRELPELMTVFSRLDLFDRVVAENGAVLYHPFTGAKRILAASPPRVFVDALRKRRVHPLSVGDVIISSGRPNKSIALEVIRDLRLDLQVILNKDSIMVVPSGVDKVSGLTVALGELGLSKHNVVGVGDAENDRGFLDYCEYSVAVANALPALKKIADLTTRCASGAGVAELIEMILSGALDS
jgi:hydroxymethylpyrimidine pyrophosphatase-like HAD family hydrolase